MNAEFRMRNSKAGMAVGRLAVIVSWLWPAEGWLLEWTNALPQVSAPWPQIPPPPYQTNGANLQFTDPAPGNKFYRLHKP